MSRLRLPEASWLAQHPRGSGIGALDIMLFSLSLVPPGLGLRETKNSLRVTQQRLGKWEGVNAGLGLSGSFAHLPYLIREMGA